MKLHTISMVNFMPYQGVVKLDFPTDDYRNVMIVFGDNMRGKTSLLNALRWGFYGKAVGRHSRPIPLQDIVNKNASFGGDWKVQVFIEFEANGVKYDLRRTADRRAHVVTPTRPEDFLVTMHLSRDGAAVSGDQIEAEIDQITPEQISRFFLFDGELLGEYESLLIEGSEQGRQIKEAIEEVLGVPTLIRGRDELGSILKSARKRQTQDLTHVQGLEKQADRQKDLTATQDSLDRDLLDLQRKLEETRSKRVKLEDELDAAAIVLSLKAKLDTLKEQQTSFRNQIESKTIERRGLLGLAWQDLLDTKLQVKRASLAARQTELTQGLRREAKLEDQIDRLKKLLSSGECPVCGQTMEEGHRHKLGSTLGEMEVEFARASDATAELQSIAAQLAALNKIRGVRAKERLGAIDRDLKLAEVGLQRSENEIENISDDIAGQDTAELARKRVIKDDAVREEGRLQTDINSVKKRIDQIKLELAISQRTIEGIAPDRAKKSTAKVNLASELERTFAASIERLRDKLRERVGRLANDAFKRMTTQKAYQGLEIDANYGLHILDENSRKVPVRSAGAEQVVALSLIDGLNRTGRAAGPVVMDTPFGRLDLKHRDNILSYLPDVTSQFVLLVHSGEIRPDTDLAHIKSRIGAVYTIKEVSSTQSQIERTSL
ncbi:AAA family ATPase [Rhizobium leguminosarum]|uniref:AAA family ATPase n=1 Tax=Rhizobium leguminosarum TaxID=384 RepID=UPI001C943B7C|nr:AAA family ATPase [Rhizobium leguminosarum]MBY5363645.1 AAA family ATPase [Rhizobium leguminosarum]